MPNPDVYAKFRDAQLKAAQPQLAAAFEGRRQQRALQITRVVTDSSGNVENAYGTMDGDPSGTEFPVQMGGRPVRAGDTIRVSLEAGRTTAPSLRYEGHIQMSRSGAATMDFEGALPAPEFASVSPWLTTLGVDTVQGVVAQGTVQFNGVEARFGPISYLLSYRHSVTDGAGVTAMSDWIDQEVPHIAADAGDLYAIQVARLSRPLPTGCSVDVKLRTRANWTAKLSTESETRTFTAATDAVSPGSATALDVSLNTPGIIDLKPSGTINQATFAAWDFEISTTASYAGIITIPPGTTPHTDAHPRVAGLNGTYQFAGTPGTPYYVAVKPVSRNGVYGTRYPGGGAWLGPYTIPSAILNPDITAPPAMGSAPSLNVSGQPVQFEDGSLHGFVTVTLGGGYNPSATADYHHTEIYTTVSDGRVIFERIEGTATSATFEWGFGTFTVKARAVDNTGNASAWSPTSSATISRPGIPGSPTGFAVTQAAMAVKVSWNPPSGWGALWVEIQRSTNGSTVDTTFGQGTNHSVVSDFNFYLDLVVTDTNTVALPTYYYRIRGLNPTGVGAWSSWSSVSVLAAHGSWLVADSITAREIAALTITAAEISAGAITAAKLETNLVVASTIRTNSGTTRIEMDGPNNRFAAWYGGILQMTLNNDTFTFNNTSGSARTVLNPGGIIVFNDAGTDFITIARNGATGIDLSGPGFGFGRTVFQFDTDTNDLFLALTTNNGNMLFGRNSAAGAQRPSLGLTGDLAIGFATSYGAAFATWIKISQNATGLSWGNGASTYGALTLTSTAAQFDTLSRFEIGPLSGGLSGFGRLGVAANGGLGTSVSSVIYTQEDATTSGVNNLQMVSRFHRRATEGASGMNDWVHRQEAWVNGASGRGGLLDLGFEGGNAYWALGRSSSTRDLYWSPTNSRVETGTDFRVNGALSKTSGTFDIAHPNPAKADTLRLRHGFVESPTRGDNLYRFVVEVSAAEAAAGTPVPTPLPDYFPFLNENPQVWVSGAGHFGRAYGTVADDGTAFALVADRAGRYNVLIVATRKDADALAGWDDTGGVEPPLARTCR